MEKFFNAEKLNGLSDISFSVGDAARKLGEILKVKCPSGKAVFIAAKSSHEKYAALIKSAVISASAKLLSAVMPLPAKNTVEYFGLLFNLPEEVRAVIVVDACLYRAASYYAHVKGLPLIFIPVNACLSGTLEKKFYLKNGKKFDTVSGAENVNVIVDETLLNENVADAFAFIMARLNTLVDYRVIRLAEGKADAKAYFIALEGIKRTYKIMFENPETRPVCALYNGLKVAIADRMDQFTLGSSERTVAYLMSGNANPLPKQEFFSALKLIELYKAAFKIKREAEILPDYVTRAERIAKLLDIEENSVNVALYSQSAKVRRGLKAYLTVINSLLSEVEELFTHTESIAGTYYSLGGDKQVKVPAAALKYGGDTPFGVNVLSVLRELGVTDNPDINA